MKKIIYAMMLGLVALGFTSCDNRPKVVGAWQGTLKEVVDGQPATYITTYTFNQDGSIAANYAVSINEVFTVSDTAEVQYNVNVAALVDVNGTWQYVSGEDDEISVVFDPSTLKVTVNPDAVVMRIDAADEQSISEAEAMKPALVSQYKAKIENQFRQRDMALLLDDVKVKSPILEFEVGNIDYTFHSVK